MGKEERGLGDQGYLVGDEESRIHGGKGHFALLAEGHGHRCLTALRTACPQRYERMRVRVSKSEGEGVRVGEGGYGQRRLRCARA